MNLHRRQLPRALAFPALAIAVWACQDATGPAASPEAGAAPRPGRTSAFHCSTLVATAEGVQEGGVPLYFPSEAHAADGSTMEYRYRRQTPSGALTHSADCVIPRTMAAVEMMNRRFQVPPELGAPKGRSREGGEVTIQGCVDDGECLLEPIVVVAPAPPTTCDWYCGGFGGGPGSGWPGYAGGGGGGGSGGAGAGAAAETNADLPETDLEQLNCANPGSAQEKAFCVRQVAHAGTLRHQRTKDAIERIRNRGGVCVDIATRASAYLDAGQVGFYPIESGMAGGYGVTSQGLAFQDRWVDEFFETPDSSGRTLDWIIAHETEHTMGQLAHSYTDSRGLEHTTNDNLCSAR